MSDLPLAAQDWSVSLLADAYLPEAGGILGSPQSVRFPPQLYVDAGGTLWLADRSGTVIRQSASSWERVDLPFPQLLGLAPQPGDSAVILGMGNSGFELALLSGAGQRLWRRLISGTPGTTLSLLQDEHGIPYLHRKSPPAAIFRVETGTGELARVVELGDSGATVLVWNNAVWRIQFDGKHRRWIRRPFGGVDEVILSGGVLDDTFLTAIGVGPDLGPLLTNGRKVVWVGPSGRERTVRLPELKTPAPPLPAVIDVLRAVPRADGTLWVVYADGAGWSVHSLRLDR